MKNTHTLSATYSSGLFPGSDVLSTLAVFYDEVWLPYPYGFDPEGVKFWSERFDPENAALWRMPPGHKVEKPLPRLEGPLAYADTIDPERHLSFSRYKWRELQEQWELLFEHGIFRTLAPPVAHVEEVPDFFYQALVQQLGYPVDQHYIYANDVTSGKIAMAIHALYGHKPSPELFVPGTLYDHYDITNFTTTVNLAATLVGSLFNFLVPMLSSLRPEEILEVREYLKDTKEGFTYYIFEQVDTIEERLTSGDPSEVKEVAQKIAERQVLAKYTEMRRQLEAKRVGFWSDVLAVGATFLQIDATPWTPKFYGQLIEAFFGPILKTAEAEAEARSNANQAFQYLAKLESTLS